MLKLLQHQFFARPVWVTMFFLSILLFGCKNNDYWDAGTPKGGFLYNKLKSNPEFSIFTQAIERAQVNQYIDKGGLYTVFAPTNTAFSKFLLDKGYGSINDVPVAELFNIVSYHIVNNMWYHYDFSTRYNNILYKQTTYLTRNKKFVKIDVATEGTFNINGIAVISTLKDIDADNGVIHGIGEVMVPLPNLEEVMQADSELASSTFYKLLQLTAGRAFDRFNTFDRDGDGRIDSAFYKTYAFINNINTSLEYRLDQTASNQGGNPVYATVLVPSNEVLDPYLAPALAKYPVNSPNKIDSLSPSYAEEVLENYFLADTVLTAAKLISRTGTLKSTNGDVLPTTSLRTEADFKRKDILASNGIIHIIKNTFPASDRQKSALGQAMIEPDFKMFMAAIQKAGLMNTYGTSSRPATFLIPTNAAFKAAKLDIDKLTLDGMQLTPTQFSLLIRYQILNASFNKAGLTGIKTADAGGSLVFGNSGNTVGSAAGTVATVSAEMYKGPNNVGYVYKTDKLLLPVF